MKRFCITLFTLTVLLSNIATGQEMHGFQLQEDRYIWKGRFVDENSSADDLKVDLMDKLSTSPYVKNIRESRNGGIVGSIEGMPEAILSTGVFVFSFGFSIDCQNGEYFVTTNNWVGKSTNPTFSGMVKSLEDLMVGPLVGKRRKENFFKSHEEAQVRIFQLE